MISFNILLRWILVTPNPKLRQEINWVWELEHEIKPWLQRKNCSSLAHILADIVDQNYLPESREDKESATLSQSPS